MTILDTPRSRMFVLWGTVACISLLGLLVARQASEARAAKQAVLTADAHVAAELVSDTGAQSVRTPVLVELFTSEGCSSCPPADALLAKLLQTQPVPNADIIVLEEHVDYWDSLGWKDRFSSRQLTDRQSQYGRQLGLDDNYTPQMIVDGTAQFVGNDSAHALRAIAQAARTPKAGLLLAQPIAAVGRISGTLTPPAAQQSADLYAVLVESMASTSVRGGENGGRTLHHVSVVRSMQKIGVLSGKPVSFSLDIPSNASPANLRVVLFAQRPNQGMVIAAVSSAVASGPTRTDIASIQ